LARPLFSAVVTMDLYTYPSELQPNHAASCRKVAAFRPSTPPGGLQPVV
jgi:hypothetical protein